MKALALALIAAALVVLAGAAEASVGGSSDAVAGPALEVTVRQGDKTILTEESADGFALLMNDVKGQLLGGYIINNHSLQVTFLDGTKKQYQQESLAKAVTRLARLRTLMLMSAVEAKGAGGKLPRPGRAVRGQSASIDGYQATSYTQSLAGVVTRNWLIPSGLKPPAAVVKAFSTVDPAAAGFLPVEIPVRIDVRLGSAWRTVVAPLSVKDDPLPAATFQPPKGWKAALLLEGTRSLQSIPATVRRTWPGNYLPVQSHQRVFAVYWGSRFTRESATTSFLNSSFTTIEGAPYISALSQYDGIGTGSFAGSRMITSAPIPAVGNSDITGIAAAIFPVNSSIGAPGAPGLWSRFDTRQPLYVVFVPQELVPPTPSNVAYHAATPSPALWLDPFGFVLFPAVPYALVRVPPAVRSGAHLDATTVSLSHETVEAATDPFGIGGFRQVSPPRGEQGEIADICQEGRTTPFVQKSRVTNIAVNTYWDQRNGVCVPESRPTVTIVQPHMDDAFVQGASIVLVAHATDPFDRIILENQITWSLDGSAPFSLDTSGSIPPPLPGPHTLRAFATDSQGASNSATVQFSVFAPVALSVTIDSPEPGAQYENGYYEAIPFAATARDASGVRFDASFTWSDSVDGALPPGQSMRTTLSGSDKQQVKHLVTVTATLPDGRMAQATVVVFSGVPT
jgi:hypothetical protein